MRRSVIVVTMLGVSARAGADPLDKAKTLKLSELEKATIMGLYVAEVKVGDDGELRMRAGVEIKCGSVKKIKKKEGKCVAALPLDKIAVSLDGYITVGGSYVTVDFTGAVDGKWLTFRAERFAPLVAAASVSSSTTDQLTLTVSDKSSPPYESRLAESTDPYLPYQAATEDALAPYYPQQEDAGYGEDGYYEGDGDGDGDGWGGYEDPNVYAQVPASYLAYAGPQMLTGEESTILAAYQALAAAHPAAFYAQYRSEASSVGALAPSSEPLSQLAAIADTLPDVIQKDIDAVSAHPAVLGRSYDVYRELRLLLGAFPDGISDDLRSKLSGLQSTVADLMTADVAAFAGAPDLPTAATDLAAWEQKYAMVLADPAYPSVFAHWVATRQVQGNQIPYLGGGAYEAVLIAALRDGELAPLVIGAARADVARATKEKLYGLWQLQDPLIFAHYAYEVQPSLDDTTKLLSELGELLVGPELFDVDVATAFMQVYDPFLTGTDAGRALALEMAPKIDSRRRTVNADLAAALEKSHLAAAKTCVKEVKQAKKLLDKWNKKFAKMKEKDRQKLRDQATSLGYQIQADRATLSYAADGLSKLGADTAWKAASDRDACKEPW